MARIGTMTTRVRASAHDGQTSVTSGPTIVVTTNGTTIQIGDDSTTEKKARFQFPLRLPVGSTVTAATLRLTPSASAAAGGTHTLEALDYFTAGLAAGMETPPVLSDTDVSGPAWTADEPVEYDVTDEVTAALASGSYSATGVITLGIVSDEATYRTLHAFDSRFDRAATLELTFSMADESEEDPYTRVVEALWDALESSPEFCAMVKPGCRIKWLGGRGLPDKPEKMTADFPEVSIIPRSGEPTRGTPSSSAMSGVSLAVFIRSGDSHLDAEYGGNSYGLLPLRWAIERAIRQWILARYFVNVTCRGVPFILNATAAATAETIDAGTAEDQQKPTVRQWKGVMTVMFDLNFKNNSHFA